MNLQSIPLSKISKAKFQSRETVDAELAESLGEVGLAVPIKVRKNGAGYEVVYGHRRVEAARKAGQKTIEALVEELDDKLAAAQGALENLARKDLTPIEAGENIKALRDLGFTWPALSKMLSVPDRTLRHYTGLLDEPRQIRKLLSDQASSAVFTVEHIEKIRGAGITDPDMKVAIAEKAVKDKLTAEQTRFVADEIAEEPELADYYLAGDEAEPESVKRAKSSKEHREEDKARRGSQDYYEMVPGGADLRDWLKDGDRFLFGVREAVRVGKLSPEGKRFFARRLEKLIGEIQKTVEVLNG